MCKAFLTQGLPQAAAQSSFHLSPLEKGGKESEPKRLPHCQSGAALEIDAGKGPGTTAGKAGWVLAPAKHQRNHVHAVGGAASSPA